jgi:hypothetical protein
LKTCRFYELVYYCRHRVLVDHVRAMATGSAREEPPPQCRRGCLASRRELTRRVFVPPFRALRPPIPAPTISEETQVAEWCHIRANPYALSGLLVPAAACAAHDARRRLPSKCWLVFAVFQGTPNGGRQFVSDTRSNRRNATLRQCKANLTVDLLESSDSKCVDRHLVYPGHLRR